MSERIARAVLELATDSATFLTETARVRGEARRVDETFEQVRRRAQLMQKDLERSVRGFQGESVVAEALKIEKALGMVGGVSKLTQAEIGRVSSVVADATFKLKAMGQEVPPSLQRLQAELRGVGAASQQGSGLLGGLSGVARQLGPLLPIASVAGLAGGLASMAGNAIQTAGAVSDLSHRLGMGTTAIQEMRAVANQTGTSVETFASAAFKLGVNVAEGGDTARRAVKDLGLEYDRLRAMRPEDQFRTVVAALEGVENAQERNRLGVALFGKTFQDIAPSIAEGYTKIAQSASKMTEEQIAALDRLGDAWVDYKDRALAAAGGVLAGAVQAWEDTVASMTLGDISRFTEAQQSRITDALGAGGEGLAKVLRDIEQARTTDIELTAAGVKAQKDYAAALAEIDAKIKALKPDQVTQLNAAIALGGEAAKDYAETIGIGEEGLDRYKEKAREAEKATKELAAAQQKAAKDAEQFRASVRNLTSALTPFAASLADAETSLGLTGASLHDLASGTLNETAQQTEAARKATDDWADANGARLAPSIRAVGAAADDADERVTSLRDSLRSAFRDLPQTIMRAFEGGGDPGKSIGALLGSKLFSEDSALVKSLSGGLTKALGKTIGGALGMMLPGLGTLFGGWIGGLADKVFGKLFGSEGRQVNDLRDQFTAAAGGIDKLAERAAAAGLTLDRFYRAKTVKEYQAAIDELNAAFARLDERRTAATSLFDQIMEAGQTGIPGALRPAIEQLIALGLLTDEQVDKLRAMGDGSVINVDQLKADLDSIGGRLESLGPKFQQANIDQTAGKYVNSIQRMIDAGGDVGGILFDAKEEISDLVNQSLKFGTTLPANMKPWIEELARAGLLVDENGNKITDLSNLKWGDKMETEAEKTQKVWDGILKAIQDLVAEIKGPLMQAINGIPDQKRIKVTTEYDDTGGSYGGDGNRGFARGVFRGVFPSSGAWARLHNVESVVPRSDELAFAMRVLAERADGATASPASTNNVVMLAMPGGGGGLDQYRVADEVMRRIPGGLATDRHFLRTSIERVIQDWVRTYGARG